MAFTLSGTAITQSGTDTSLAGLSGISGVTTQVIPGLYPLTIYTLSDRKLRVTGTLPMSRNEKLIFTDQVAAADILNIDGGTFPIDYQYTLNGYTYSLPQEAIVFSLSTGGSWNTQVLVVKNAGKFIARNAIIRIPHSIWFTQNTSGQVLLENVIIDKTGSVGDIQTNHAGSGNNNTVFRNVTIIADNQSGITFRNATAPTVENVRVIHARDAFNNESTGVLRVRGLEPGLGNVVDISQFGNRPTLAINPQKGVQFLWGGHINDGVSTGNTGTIAVYQELTATIKDATGQPIPSAVFYLSDNPIAADPAQTSVNKATLIGTINPVNRQVYVATSDINGALTSQDVLIGTGRRTVGGAQIVGGNDNRIRPRGVNTTASADATDDLYNYSVFGYNYLQVNNPVVLKSGNGSVVNITPQLLPDANVTLSESAAVTKLASSFVVNTATNTIVVTASSTLDDLYDAMKAWKTRAVQSQLEYPTIETQPVVASGTSLVTAMTIEGIEFLSTGSKFTALQATATASGAVSNLTMIGNVSQQTPAPLSNVVISGTLNYNTNADISIAISNNTEIGTVANSGTGIVTITRDATSSITDYSDPQINFLDSSIVAANITSATIYQTAAHRDANTNAGATFTSNLDFKYGGLLNGVTMQDTIYIRVVVESITLFSELSLAPGNNTLDLGVQGQLSALNAKADLGAKEATLLTRSTFNPTTDTVARVTLVDTTTTNTDMRGTDNALLAAAYTAPLDAPATQAAAAAALTDYDAVVPADLVGLATVANIDAARDAVIAEVDQIPVNPLLTTDARLDNLDAPVSSRLASASYTAPDNAQFTATDRSKLESLTNADLTGLATSEQLAALNNLSAQQVWAHANRALTDKAGFELSSTEKTLLVSAIRADIEREGGVPNLTLLAARLAAALSA